MCGLMDLWGGIPVSRRSDLSRRHSGDCGLSRLDRSATGRPLQPEAFGTFSGLPG